MSIQNDVEKLYHSDLEKQRQKQKKKKKKKPDRQQKAPQYAELFLRTVFIWHLYRCDPMQYLFR